MANYSIKEAEALVFKASRGAYLTWGLAEEAGHAAGWLLENGFSALEAVVALLDENEGKSCRELGPVDPEKEWRPADEALCPFITGTLLLDSAERVAAGETVHAGPVAHPALLLPFVAGVAKAKSIPVQVRWIGFEALFDGDGVEIVRGGDGLFAAEMEMVTVEPTTLRPVPLLTKRSRVDVNDATCARLEQFAFRTYVPETEESRLFGAGGGTVDSD